MPRKHIDPSESEYITDTSVDEIEESESSQDINDNEEQLVDPKHLTRADKKTLAKEYEGDDFRNVIFKNIDDNYAYGKLDKIKIVLMRKNGYVNATKLCADASKRFCHWRENDSSKVTRKEVCKRRGLEAGEDIITITKGSNKTKGSYVHPNLIVHIAIWCSPIYSVNVSEIMNNYHINAVIEEKDRLLKKKGDKIDRLLAKLDEMQKEDKKQMNLIVDMHKTTKQQLRKIDNLQDTCEEMKDNILIISNDRVIRGEPKYDNQLFIFENNGNPKDVAEGEIYYEYRAIRTAKQSMPYRIKDHKLSFPKAKSLLEIDTPNAINLWQRYLRKNNGNVESHYSDFNVCKIYSIEQMLRDLESIHDERLDVNR